MKFNQKGFGAIEAILILVIVAALGGVGWFVYQSKNKTEATQNKTSQAQGEPQKTDNSKLTEYCDAFQKACITYGPEWKADIATDTLLGAPYKQLRLIDKSKSKEIEFRTTSTLGTCSWVGSTIRYSEAISEKDDLYVIGYTKIDDISDGGPGYLYALSVVNKAGNNLTVGTTGCIKGNYQFKNLSTKQLVGYLGYSNKFQDEKSAVDWFGSDDAKAIVTVLKTLKLN